jgi:hypothetical protein
MTKDPIIEETRALREQYAAQFNQDREALFNDILRRQSESGRKLVTLPPRRPKRKSEAA